MTINRIKFTVELLLVVVDLNLKLNNVRAVSPQPYLRHGADYSLSTSPPGTW